MPTINQLPTVTQISGGDQLPLYLPNTGDARRCSVTNLLAYFSQNFASPDYVTIISAPTSNGFNVSIGSQTTSVFLILNPTGTFASGTVTLPPASSCFDGQQIIVASSAAVGSLTINGNGATIIGAPTGLNVGGGWTLRFSDQQSTWYCIASDPSASEVSFIQAGTGAVTRTAQDKMRDIVSVQDFGAVGDGVTDDTSAIVAAISAMSAFSSLYFPAGDYKVTSKISFNPPQNNVSFFGDGAGATTLRYAGAATNDDCFVFGASGAQRSGWSISGIRFISNTVMTAGAGVHAYAINRSTWRDVAFADQDANSNFYIGVWFDGADMVQVSQFRARASQDAVRINGITGLGRADLFLHEGKISSSNIGLHVAGNFGGLYVDATDIINNATNVKISRDVVNIANRETFFGPGALIDSASTLKDATTYDGINVDISDTDGFIFFDGTWLASCGTCVRVGASYVGNLTFNGGIIFNCFNTFGGTGDGIRMLGNSKVYVRNVLFRNVDNVAIGCDVINTNAEVRFVTIMNDVVTPYQNITDIVSSNTGIASGVDSNPRISVIGENSSLVTYDSSGLSWLSASLSRSDTPGVQAAVTGKYSGLALCGSDGVQFRRGAGVVAETDGAISSGILPTKIIFSATNTSGTLVDYWSIRANGSLQPVSDNNREFGSSSARASKSWVVDAHTFPLTSVSPTINGEMVFELTSNTQLKIKVQGSDGVIRTASLTLT